MTRIDRTPKTIDASLPALSPQQSHDCLEASTRVRMGDGCWKPVSMIQPGDAVQSDDGRSAVVDIVRGRESEIICLEAESGAILRASAGQPVATPAGLKRADGMAVGDSIVLPSGGLDRVQARSVEHGEFDVFSLVFDRATCFDVDGFVVGDHDKQQRMPQRLGATKEADSLEDALVEIKRLRAKAR